MCTRFILRAQATPSEQMAGVSNVVFISYICPAIISPQTYGLCSVSTAPNAHMQRNLLRIATVLQRLGSRRAALAAYAVLGGPRSSSRVCTSSSYARSVVLRLAHAVLPRRRAVDGARLGADLLVDRADEAVLLQPVRRAGHRGAAAGGRRPPPLYKTPLAPFAAQTHHRAYASRVHQCVEHAPWGQRPSGAVALPSSAAGDRPLAPLP